MSFQQGLSGLDGASNALDTIGNNISNSSTVGFKGATAQFSDIYAAAMVGSSANQVGIGTTTAAVAQQFTQGNFTTTGNPLDVAINGNGFYRLSNQTGASSGQISYTRNGQFSVNSNGYIVNSAGLFLTGILPDASGNIPSSGPAGAIQLNTSLINPKSTTASQIGLNLDSTETVTTVTPFDPTNPKTYNDSTTQTVYDSLGNPHSLQMYFVKTDTSNQWLMYTELDGDSTTLNSIANGAPDPALAGGGVAGSITVNGVAATGGIALNFNSSGALTTTMPMTQTSTPALWPPAGYSLAATTGATNLVFSLDLTGTTQFGAKFGVNAIAQDGYAPGNLTGIKIGSDGTVSGTYSNGQLRAMGRLVLSTFQNNNGLQNMGGNLWQETAASGQPVTGTPGQGNLGVLQSGSVEDSNVNLTSELVNMIVQQRAYQANAQTIKTQDTILQTLVNLQ